MDLIDKEAFHKEHHSRNLGLLTEDEQRKIDATTILIAGCGVGSLVALSAARIGFEKFILVDGDTVELSNINRQAYYHRDVGKKKVNALAHNIKLINPHAQIRKYPVFVDKDNAARFVKKADIVVDTIDPDAAVAILAMHRAAKKAKKWIVQPTDVGWGAMVQVFSPESVSYEEMIGLNPKTPLEKIDSNKVFEKFIQFFTKIMPDYVQRVVLDFTKGKLAHYPQPVSAAYILSAMAVIALKRIALDLPVKVAPEYIIFDPNTMLDPNEK